MMKGRRLLAYFVWENLDFSEVPNVRLLGNLLTFIRNQQGPLAFALL